jgi:hypothetical protein
MTKAVNAGSAAAKVQLQQGMGLLAQVAQTKGADAAKALKQAFLSGDVTTAMDQLKSIWGADVPISDKELAQITAAFKTAGKNGVDQWSGMLDLIATVAKTKGTAAAQALTSALLSGDMAQVQKQLAAIGASVREIPGSKTISVSVSTTLVGPKSFTIPVYTKIVKTTWDKDGNGIPDDIQAPSTQARGSVLDFYARGGLRKPGAEQHVAQIAPAGAWRVWAEPETAGEAYLPLAASKRTRSKAILAEVARRFGASVVYHANGGMSGWQYQPAGSTDSPVTLSSIASDSMNKAGTAVDLAKFAKNLRTSVAQAEQWRKDLATVARRCGQDVADALQDMGADGVSLTHKMATGTTTYVKQMASELKSLAATAKATLSDYTAQLGSAATQTAAFQANLAKLAGEGYGDLAARLAAQGDDAAQQLAAQAAASKTAAAKANSASKAASATLSSDDLSDLLTIIAAVTSNKVGIHTVADATGLGEDRIIEVANAGLSRLKKALGSRSAKLVADLGRANKGLSYSSGGVLTPGLYATSNGIVRFAEPETAGEAFIPLGSAKRSTATAVLEDVAQRFGYQLTASGVSGPTRLVDARPAGGVHVVVVREQPAALIGQMPVTVNGGGGADTAQQVGGEVMRQLRRAQRGGRI